jgi:sphinganine-1-phosphate aldolase
MLGLENSASSITDWL